MLLEDILCFFVDDIIVYIEIQNESPKSLSELKSKFSNITGYEINIQIQLCLYSNNGQSEIENLKHHTQKHLKKKNQG